MDNTKQMLANANGEQLSALYQSAVSKLAATTDEAQGIVLLPNGINPRSKAGSNGQVVDSTNIPIALQGALQQYTVKQFLFHYGYTYNGPRTMPPDLASGGKVVSGEDLIIFAQGDFTTMTQLVDNTLLQSGGLPAWFSSAYTTDLLKTISVLSDKGNEDWQYEPFTKQYTDPTGQQGPISVACMMTYATQNFILPGGGHTANYTLISYVSVYYNSSDGGPFPPPGQLDTLAAPVHIYNIIKYTVPTGNAIVSASIGTYIISLAQTDAKVVMLPTESRVEIIVNFQNNMNTNSTQWVETALHNCGFISWSKSKGQADATTAVKLAFIWAYTRNSSG